MARINAKRLISDLRELAEIGRYKTGVHRPTYSAEDMKARNWLRDRMQNAGLTATIDGIGNVIGRHRAGPGPRLLLGSHIETQPYAGWLDGALGVIYGLEVARAFAEDPACKDLQVDVGAWADEEGHYGIMVGSHSFCGLMTEEMLDASKSKANGKSLREALAEAGLAGRPREHITPGDYTGYLEAHIEQGDYLESSDLQLGIVTGIVGIYTFRIIFRGEQNHAGTTRMAIRKDAGVSLHRLWHAIDQSFLAISGPHSVWTSGKVSFEPGMPSIIPGQAEMLFQFRDIAPEQMELFERTLRDLVDAADKAGPCRVELEVVGRSKPHAMAPLFQDLLEGAAKSRAPDAYMRMPSAAGHDAQVFAAHLPAGMLFVPSIGGISHHYAEDTKEADIILGCEVFADAAESILRNAMGSSEAGAVSAAR